MNFAFDDSSSFDINRLFAVNDELRAGEAVQRLTFSDWEVS